MAGGGRDSSDGPEDRGMVRAWRRAQRRRSRRDLRGVCAQAPRLTLPPRSRHCKSRRGQADHARHLSQDFCLQSSDRLGDQEIVCEVEVLPGQTLGGGKPVENLLVALHGRLQSSLKSTITTSVRYVLSEGDTHLLSNRHVFNASNRL